MGLLSGRNHYALGVVAVDQSLLFLELSNKNKNKSTEISQYGKLPMDTEGWLELSYLAKTKAVYLAIPAIKFIKKEIPTFLHASSDLQSQYFSDIPEALLFDFIPDQHQPDKTHVFAMREAEIHDYLNIISQAHFKIMAIEPDNYAICRACLAHHPMELNSQEAGWFQFSKRSLFFDSQSVLLDISNDSMPMEQNKKQFLLHYPDYKIKQNILINLGDILLNHADLVKEANYLAALGAALRGIV
jgi:hypothetical protein